MKPNKVRPTVLIAISACLMNITYIKTRVIGHHETTLFYVGAGWGIALGLIACAVLWLLIARLPSAPSRSFRIQWQPMLLLLPLLFGRQTGDSFDRGTEFISVWSGYGSKLTPGLLGVAILAIILWQRLQWLQDQRPFSPPIV